VAPLAELALLAVLVERQPRRLAALLESLQFVQHLLRYAVGRALYPEEQGAVDTLAGEFKASGYLLTETLLDYVASDRFALRQEDATP